MKQHLTAPMLGLAAVGMLALAGCSTTSPNRDYGYGSSYPAQPAYCADCGIVTRIDTYRSTSSTPANTGAILGGIVGAVAGHEISDKTGGSKGNQNVAAVAGAVAGAAAGKAIQDRTTGDRYDIHVRLDDGRTVVIQQHDLGGIRENTYVRVVNGKVVLR